MANSDNRRAGIGLIVIGCMTALSVSAMTIFPPPSFWSLMGLYAVPAAFVAIGVLLIRAGSRKSD